MTPDKSKVKENRTMTTKAEKHTPGPWIVEKKKGVSMNIMGGGFKLARVWDKEANAALIASAPELLEALKELVEWAPYPNKENQFSIRLGDARYAIAKAEGK